MRRRINALTPFYERELAGFLGRQTPEEIADIWSELRVIRELIAILRDPVSGDSTAARARELRRLQRAFERAGTYTRTQLAMHRDVRAPLLAAYRRPRLADALDGTPTVEAIGPWLGEDVDAYHVLVWRR